MKNSKKRRGFTLIELLATLVVLGLLFLVGFYFVNNAIDSSKEKSYKVVINDIETSAVNYVLENNEKIDFISIDNNVNSNEYQCIKVEWLVDKDYFDKTILNSSVNKNDTVKLDDYVYIERDVNNKTINISEYVNVSEGSDYLSLCNKDMDTNDDIYFTVNPEGWSQSKNVKIYYNADKLLDGTGVYKYKFVSVGQNKDDVPYSISDGTSQIVEVKENGTVYARIEGLSKNDASLKIDKIDTVRPAISMENYNGNDKIVKKVIIPLVVKEGESGFNKKTFTENDIKIFVGETEVDVKKNLILKNEDETVGEYNYDLEIDDISYSYTGKLKIEILDKMFEDNANNLNEGRTFDSGITVINTYKVNYFANGGIGSMATTTCTYSQSCTLRSNSFSKVGYIFKGWSTTEGSSAITYTNNQSILFNEFTEDINLYAVWEKNTYMLTADANGGIIPATTGWTVASGGNTATKSVIYGTTYGTLPTPTRTGYTFNGWYSAASGGTIVTSSSIVNTNGDHKIYANYNANAIEFNDQTFSKTYSLSSQTMSITGASNGTGSYTYSITGGNTGSYFSISGITLTMKEKTPVATYNLTVQVKDNNSGVYDDAKITVTVGVKSISGATVTLDPTTYVYDGSAKTPTVTVKDGSTTLTKDTDYTVTYSNNTNVGTATVTITGKGNYTGTASKTFTITKASCTCTISSVPTLKYPGTTTGNIEYNCTGDGTRSVVSGTTSVITVGTVGTTSTPLTAKTTGESTITVSQEAGTNYNACTSDSKTITVGGTTYTITLNGNGATTDGTTSVIATYNSSAINPSLITLPQRKYTVSGFGTDDARNSTGATISSTSALTSTYTFNGWYTATSGGSKVISNSATPAYVASVSGYTDSNSKWIKAGNVTLNAQWSGVAVTLPTITKVGYTCGWTTSSTGTTISYASGASYTPSEDTTMYAVCTNNGYTLTVDANGGMIPATTGWTVASGGATATKNVIYGSTYGTLPVPTRSGYIFNGWKDGNGTTITSSSTMNTASNHTITAQWTEDKSGPTYSSYEIKNITNSGYDVYIYGVSDPSGVDRVQFPTWTSYDGQDDIQSSWSTNSVASGTNKGSGTYYYRVNTTDHKGEAGSYNTHIYLYDSLGNQTSIGIDPVTVPGITVTINVNNTSYGSVSKSSVSVGYGATYSANGVTLTFPAGQTVTASTKAVTGYTISFSDWSSTSETITAAMTITANFIATDSQEPTISVSNTVNGSAYDGEWINQSVSSKIIFDDNGSGINPGTLQWKCGTEDWSTINNTSTTGYIDSWSAQRNDDQCYYRIADKAGKFAQTDPFPIRIDTEAPTGTISVTSNVTTITTSFSDVSDNLSGVKEYQYLIQTSSTCPTSGYTASTNSSYNFTKSTAGTYYVCARIVDNAGNIGTYSKSISITAATLSFSSSNLLYGLSNISSGSGEYMTYSVSNGTVTVTAKSDDGYGYTNGRVYLEANKTYTFNCITNGTWGTTSGEGGVEAFLMLNGSTSTAYYHMTSNSNYTFTPTVSGLYWLRLDVNKTGQSNTFSNIRIEQIQTSTLISGTTIGTLPTVSRTNYTFNGWYTEESGGTQITSSTIVPSSNTTYYAQWTSLLPIYTYLKSDGSPARHEFIDDGSGNWRIKFYETGILTFISWGSGVDQFDVFLVGGGGGGGGSSISTDSYGGGGGGGGYVFTSKKNLIELTSYNVTIGAGGAGGASRGTADSGNYGASGGNGKASSISNFSGTFSCSANGGSGGASGSTQTGGSGGSGGGGGSVGWSTYVNASWGRYWESYGGYAGQGGSNGGNGTNAKHAYTGGDQGGKGGTGAGKSTAEFGDANNSLYAGGGAGGYAIGIRQSGVSGKKADGSDGGGGASGKNATFYGGGGGGGNYDYGHSSPDGGTARGGNGYQGIVIIRNNRDK